MAEITWKRYEDDENWYMYHNGLVGSVGKVICYRSGPAGAVLEVKCPEGATIDELKALCVTLYRMDAS